MKPPVLKDVIDVEYEAIVQMFLTEADDQLRVMEESLVALEAAPEDDETLQRIFRAAHTLKGNAASLGFQPIAELAHVVEDVLDRLRKRSLAVGGPLVTLLLQSVDAFRQLVPQATSGGGEMAPAHKALLKRLVRTTRTKAVADPVPQPAPEAVARGTEGGAPASRTLRVDVDKLDRMLNLTGEIAIARGRLARMLAALGGVAGRELLEAHLEAERLQMELQEQVMKARMVPVGPTFRQHVRTVRDVAAAHGKAARLEISGEDVEVDTRVIEHLRDPLTHLLRNAVDHGVEPPDVRKARGKEPCARLSLRAFHEASSIVIELEDDGAGFSRERIRERARARGVSDAERFSDPELLRLVLEPGFSTAEAVTHLSGRGVGMDVVRRNVEALRGTLSLESREGEGSRVTIRLPLTLAIIEGFGVGVGSDTYVIPLDAVVECVELSGEEHEQRRGRGVINLRGRPLPYLRLRDLFGCAGEGASGPRENIVVVQHAGGRAGLAVDVLYGENQTVIKPLGKLFRGIPGISGSAILGNGRVALILDMPALFGAVLEAEPSCQTEVGRLS